MVSECERPCPNCGELLWKVISTSSWYGGYEYTYYVCKNEDCGFEEYTPDLRCFKVLQRDDIHEKHRTHLEKVCGVKS